MGMLAVITRKPAIGLSEWLNYIASNPALVRPHNQEIDNPLMPSVKVTIRPAEGEVDIIINNQWIGTIEPGDEHDVPGILIVYAIPEHTSAVKDFVRGVAPIVLTRHGGHPAASPPA